MRFRREVSIILAIYAVLAFTMLSLTPYRQAGLLQPAARVEAEVRIPDIGAPDERAHANYVQHIADGKGFPVFKPGSPDLGETYQSHQPPLFYGLGAIVTKLTGGSVESSLTGRSVRALNLIIGAITLILIYLLAREVSGDETVGIIAMALTGFMPMFVALHGAISNDPLLIMLMTASVFLTTKAIRDESGLRYLLAAGWVTGLAILTKTTGILLVPGLIAAGFFVRSRSKARFLPAAIAIFVASPWLVRNTMLYGDPLALKAFGEAFVGSAQKDQIIEGIAAMRQAKGLSPDGAVMEFWTQWFGKFTMQSFFGVFGYMSIKHGDLIYNALFVIFALGLIGYVLSFRVKNPDAEIATQDQKITSILWLGTLLVVASFVRFNLTYFQAQARYLYPMIGAIMTGFAIGFRRWLPGPTIWAVPAIVLAICIYSMMLINQIFPLMIR